MSDDISRLAQLTEAVSETSDGAMSGLLALVVQLARKQAIDAEDIKIIADALTSKMPEGRHPGADLLFARLLPGYQRPQKPAH